MAKKIAKSGMPEPQKGDNTNLSGTEIVDSNNEKDANEFKAGLNTADSNAPDTKIHDQDLPKAAVNTAMAGEAVAASSLNASFGARVAGTTGGVTFGGGASTGVDQGAMSKANSTYRSSDRTGKRIDPITRKVDFLNAEILNVDIKRSKSLSETDDKQGYNGNYANEHAITGRVNGVVPADENYNRSVDIITHDTLYYPLGQCVTGKTDTQYKIRKDADSSEYIDLRYGSFLPRTFKVWFTPEGKLIDMDIASEDLSTTGVDEVVSRLSNTTYFQELNRNELDRITIANNSSNESKDNWSPLGEAIIDATDQNLLLRHIDATAGDFVYLSYRKLTTALAHQVNKTAKDGLRVSGPIAEMMNRYLANDGNSKSSLLQSVSEDEGYFNAFNSAEALQNGGAGLWLRIMDSVTKYNTKGKVLSLPLSFKNALNMAQANFKPLVFHTQLQKLMNKCEAYSTVDGPYDGFHPVVITDGAMITTPYDLNQTFYIVNGDYYSRLQTMSWSNLRNVYKNKICDIFTMGLYSWFSRYGSKIVSELTSSNVKGTLVYEDHEIIMGWDDDGVEITKTIKGALPLTIPITSTTLGVSMWDLIVCSIVEDIIKARIRPMREVMEYEQNFGYPYSGVEHINEISASSDNFSCSGPDSKIVTGQLSPLMTIREKFPELFWLKKYDHDSNCLPASYGVLGDQHAGYVGTVMLPHYFVQNQFKLVDEYTSTGFMNALLLSNDGASIAYPSQRSGVTLSSVDQLYGMSERDYRSCFDRMVVYPGYIGFSKYQDISDQTGVESKIKMGCLNRGTGGLKTLDKPLSYKYSVNSDGQVVVNYNIYADDVRDKAAILNIYDILSTPREFGYVQVPPSGVLTPTANLSDVTTYTYNAKWRNLSDAYFGKSGAGYKAIIYHIDQDYQCNLLDDTQVNVDIAAQLTYNWDCLCAGSHCVQANKAHIIMTGNALFNSGATAGTIAAGSSLLTPFTEGSYDSDYGSYDYATGSYSGSELMDTSTSVISCHAYLWNRLQRLYFVINPFDADVVESEEYTKSLHQVNNYDIYDILYVFNFCGFRASDYSELINDIIDI